MRQAACATIAGWLCCDTIPAQNTLHRLVKAARHGKRTPGRSTLIRKTEAGGRQASSCRESGPGFECRKAEAIVKIAAAAGFADVLGIKPGTPMKAALQGAKADNDLSAPCSMNKYEEQRAALIGDQFALAPLTSRGHADTVRRRNRCHLSISVAPCWIDLSGVGRRREAYSIERFS
jgi:hypothetical protein